MQNKEKSISAILAMVVGFLVLYLIFDIRWLLTLSVVIGCIGLFSTWLTDWIVRGWMALAEFLGKINATILLSLIFFIFLTPVALLMRLVKGVDTLRLKKVKEDSVFEVRNHTYEAKDLKNIW